MKNLIVNVDKIFPLVDRNDFDKLQGEIGQANHLLESGKGAGSDFLGWVNLPNQITDAELAEVERVATRLRSLSDVVIVIGIGGSYLGAKAVLNALNNNFNFGAAERKPEVVFAGQNLCEDYIYELMEATANLRISLIVISKSGTTTEPAVAFRLLKSQIEKRFGKQGARERIVAVTDAKRGALRILANQEGYDTFVISDDIGGRFSVLTAVGLLPIAAGGFNVRELVCGAREMLTLCDVNAPIEENPAARYAMARTMLYRSGKKIEIMASYNPKLQYIAEWWKQLYGESEGKNGKGIFPASVTLTADLHSMGQYIQDGERSLFETVLSVKSPNHKVVIESDAENLDGLNFLAGKRISEVNAMAELGTMLAHVDGGVPNILITLPKISEYYIGGLLYMYERGCGMSGYALGVNPFDQPGVEAYKSNMFALLEKPGFERATAEIKKRLG